MARARGGIAATCGAHAAGRRCSPRHAEHSQPKYGWTRQSAVPGVFASVGQQAVLAIQKCENGSHVLESELAARYRQTSSQRARRMARFPLGMASLDLRPEEQSRI